MRLPVPRTHTADPSMDGPAALQHHESLVMVQDGGVLATATVADYGRWAL